MAKKKIKAGTNVTGRFSTGANAWPHIPTSVDEFVTPVMGGLTGQTEGEATARILQLEDEARGLLYDKFGDRYQDSVKIPFGKLDAPDRTRILTEIEQIRGFRSTEMGAGILEQGFGPHMMKGFEEVAGTSEKPYGLMDVNIMAKLQRGEEITAQDIWYATISVQHGARKVKTDQLGRATESVANLYQVSGEHLSQEYMEKMAAEINARHRAGKGFLPDKYSLIDIESPSLNPEEGLWQIAMRRYEGGELVSEPLSFKFPNALMKNGVVGNQGKTQTISEFLNLPGELDGSAGPQLKLFLEELEKSDYNIVGHNVGFDYGHLIRMMKQVPEYAMDIDPDYYRMVNKFEHVFMHESNRVMDTNILARLILGGQLDIDDRLRARSTGTPASVENLLLSTDVLQHSVDQGDLTPKRIDTLLTKGTHDAEVDVELENQIAQYLNDIFIGSKQPVMRPVREAWASKIMKGRALGPRIEMDPDFILPEIIRNLDRLGLSTSEGLRLSPQEQMILLSRLSSRERGVPGARPLAEGMGILRNMTENIFSSDGRFRGDVGAHIPSLDEFEQMQRAMEEAGVPFSRLHYIERYLTGTLGQAAFGDGKISGRHTQRAVAQDAGDLLGEIYMRGVKSPKISRKGTIMLPAEMVEDALGRVHSYGISPFDIPAQGATATREARKATSDLGIRFRFSEGASGDKELETLLAYLNNSDNYGKFGLNAKTAQQMIEQLQTTGTRSGIQVASFASGEGGPVAEDLANIFANVMGGKVDVTRDQQNALSIVRLPEELRGEDPEYQRWGPIVHSKGHTEQHADELIGEIKTSKAGEHIRSLKPTERVTFGRQAEGIGEAIGGAVGGSTPPGFRPASQIRATANSVYDAVFRPRNLAIGVGVATLALGSYYFYKRHKDNSKLNETFREQPYESSQSRRQSAPDYQTGSYVPTPVQFSDNRNQRRAEYMRTAEVTSNADRNKIGHTRMGNDRYNHLYGGR